MVLRPGDPSSTVKAHTRIRLLRDIDELMQHPEPGMDVHVHEDNIHTMCLLITPTQGDLMGLRLHIEVEIPPQFPLAPPQMFLSTALDHPNVIGDWICCDILRTEREMDIYHTRGFTPAYSLQSIFMQVTSFFSDATSSVQQFHHKSHEIIYDMETSQFRRAAQTVGSTKLPRLGFSPQYISAMESAREYVCKRECGYGTTIAHLVSPAPSPEIENAVLDATTFFPLKDLPADLMKAILNRLDTTDILRFASAFPPVANLVDATSIIAKREVRCFCMKTNASEAILGIGVGWDKQNKSFRSGFDYISHEAFDVLNVRRGVRRDKLDHWLPLAIDAPHFAKAEKEVVKRLETMEMVMRRALPLNSSPSTPAGYRVLCSFANNIVVSLMTVVNPSFDGHNNKQHAQPRNEVLHASERAVSDYFSIAHLLTSLAVSQPKVLAHATQSLTSFIDDPAKRIKAYTPNLGELIVMMLVVPAISWTQFCTPLMDELLARNVVWALDPHKGAGKTGLAFLETNKVDEWRLNTTFEAEKTSLRVLMFQHLFLEKFREIPFHGSDALVGVKCEIDARYGLPPRDLPTQLVASIKEIYDIKDHMSFFARLGVEQRAKGQITSYLRDRVVQSEEQGYHVCRYPLPVLKWIRTREDAAFARVNTRVPKPTKYNGGQSFFATPPPPPPKKITQKARNRKH